MTEGLRPTGEHTPIIEQVGEKIMARIREKQSIEAAKEYLPDLLARGRSFFKTDFFKDSIFSKMIVFSVPYQEAELRVEFTLSTGDELRIEVSEWDRILRMNEQHAEIESAERNLSSFGSEVFGPASRNRDIGPAWSRGVTMEEVVIYNELMDSLEQPGVVREDFLDNNSR